MCITRITITNNLLYCMCFTFLSYRLPPETKRYQQTVPSSLKFFWGYSYYSKNVVCNWLWIYTIVAKIKILLDFYIMLFFSCTQILLAFEITLAKIVLIYIFCYQRLSLRPRSLFPLTTPTWLRPLQHCVCSYYKSSKIGTTRTIPCSLA